MYVKGLIETWKVLGRLGIKNKDILGMGADVVKMGKSLFNTRVNPKLLQFIEKTGKIPPKILENIKLHARTLKNVSENQKNLFLENIKSIQKAKTPIIPKSSSPVTGVRQPGASVKELPEWTQGWKPTVIKGGKDKLADGGITRIPFEDGTEPEGPQLPENNKKSLDEIVASIIGKREDRPDSDGIAGLRGGPKAGQARSRIQDNADTILKGFFYLAQNSDKETSNTLYSAMDGMIDFNIKNEATGVEQDLAKKLVAGTFDIKEGVPTRIDENTVFDIALKTFDKLPADLQAQITASTNLAKDQSWSALLEGNNLGLEYNSDNQNIEGYYNIEIDSETLKPTIIRPMFEKDNLNDEIKKSLFIGHGDFPPDRENFSDPEMYMMAMQMWEADKNKEYFGIDLVSKPESNYTGATGTFTTENVSGWGEIKTGDNTKSSAKTEITGIIPNYLLKDSPIEISASHYQDLDTDDKETMLRADIPVSESITPYVEKKTGDGSDELQYGIDFNKTGNIGNFDYQLQADIDQNKDYRLQADMGTDNVKLGGWYDADGNWQAGVTASWKWGEPETKKKHTYTTSDPNEAWDFSKKKLFATGGIANHFRKR
jgi:hypothetical protein